MSAAIETYGLTKHFGDVRALDGIDLTVPEGSIFGFLGPNGAGKTTTLKVLTGLIKPTSGTAKVLGDDVTTASMEARAKIGFLPDVPAYYEWMTAEQFLRFVGRLFGLPGSTLEERIGMLLDLAGLTGVEGQRIGGYSRGMKQRLGIAQALMNSPRLLMLDEPTSALDPVGRKDVLDMIAALRGRATVFFSTHILSDVERVCDTVAVLDKGRLKRISPIHELMSTSTTVFRLEVERGTSELQERLSRAPWVVETAKEGAALRLTVSNPEAARLQVPGIVAQLGLPLAEFRAEEPTLEDAFLDIIGEER